MKKLFLLLSLSFIAQIYSSEEHYFAPFGRGASIQRPQLNQRQLTEEEVRTLSLAPFRQLETLSFPDIEINEQQGADLARSNAFARLTNVNPGAQQAQNRPAGFDAVAGPALAAILNRLEPELSARIVEKLRNGERLNEEELNALRSDRGTEDLMNIGTR